MEDITKFLNYTLSEGLPDDYLALDGRIGRSNAAEKISRGTGSVDQNFYTDIKNTFYSDGKDLRTGLVSGLRQVTNDALESVKTAWTACNNALPSINRLETACSTAKPPLQSTSPSLVSVLRTEWDSFSAAQTALENAQAGPKQSLQALLNHLDKRTNPRFEQFRLHARDMEVRYDQVSQQRYILENDYENRRWEQKQELMNGGNDWLAKEASPWTMRNKSKYGVKSLGVENAHQNLADQRYYWLLDWSRNDGDCLFGWNSTKFYQDAPSFGGYWLSKVNRVDPAKITSDGVYFPGMNEIDSTVDMQGFSETSHNVWLPHKDCNKYKPFYKVICRQQAILRTLSGSDGPWRKEDGIKEVLRSTIAFREHMDMTLDNLQDLTDVVQTFNSLVIAPVVELGQALRCDLQDLHANLFFGDDEDQQENLSEVLASIAKWTSTFKSIYEKFSKCLTSIHIRERCGVAEINLSRRVVRPDVDWSQVVMGIDLIDQYNNRDVSVLASQDQQAGLPKLASYDGSTQMVNARARLLELPKSNACEFGRCNLDGKDMKLNRNFSEPLNFDFPITFTNKYSSAPIIVCWLQGVEISCTANVRVRTDAINITKDSFTMRLASWWDTKLRRLHACWFAYSPDHPHFASGRHRFYKRGVHSDGWAPCTRVTFPKNKFPKRRPCIFAAFSLLDLGNEANPRCNLMVTDVTKDGIKIGADPWGDTDCFSVEVTYLAFDQDFYQY